MPRTKDYTAYWRLWRVFAWSVLIAIPLLLTAQLHILVSNTVLGSEQTELAATGLTPATAALADGDDVRFRFLVNVPSQDRWIGDVGIIRPQVKTWGLLMAISGYFDFDIATARLVLAPKS
jgi:hypothetical protein